MLADLSGMKVAVKVPAKYMANQAGSCYDSGTVSNQALTTQLAGGGQAMGSGMDLATLVLVVVSVIFIVVGAIMYLGIRMGWF